MSAAPELALAVAAAIVAGCVSGITSGLWTVAAVERLVGASAVICLPDAPPGVSTPHGETTMTDQLNHEDQRLLQDVDESSSTDNVLRKDIAEVSREAALQLELLAELYSIAPESRGRSIHRLGSLCRLVELLRSLPPADLAWVLHGATWKYVQIGTTPDSPPGWSRQA